MNEINNKEDFSVFLQKSIDKLKLNILELEKLREEPDLDNRIITVYRELGLFGPGWENCVSPAEIGEKIGIDEEKVAERLKELFITGQLKIRSYATCSECCHHILAESSYKDGIWCILLNKRVDYDEGKCSLECPLRNTPVYIEVVAMGIKQG